jgi:hypothetical protein
MGRLDRPARFRDRLPARRAYFWCTATDTVLRWQRLLREQLAAQGSCTTAVSFVKQSKR